MGKTRAPLKKVRDTKGTFHGKMGTIKDRNSMDQKDAEDIKKRWQKYTEDLYKKYLNDPDNLDGIITHLQPDILECEVKWALETEQYPLLTAQLPICNAVSFHHVHSSLSVRFFWQTLIMVTLLNSCQK